MDNLYLHLTNLIEKQDLVLKNKYRGLGIDIELLKNGEQVAFILSIIQNLELKIDNKLNKDWTVGEIQEIGIWLSKELTGIQVTYKSNSYFRTLITFAIMNITNKKLSNKRPVYINSLTLNFYLMEFIDCFESSNLSNIIIPDKPYHILNDKDYELLSRYSL